MAQLLYRIKNLYEYVQKELPNAKFTDRLGKCVDLTFDKNIVSVGDEKQTEWVLKDSCTALGGDEDVVRDVKTYLEQAYDVLHTGSGRCLSYENYKRFMEVCRGWGSFTADSRMMRWYQETLQEYTTGGRKQAAEPTNAGTKTGEAERMQNLLAKLKKLIKEFE